MAGDSEVEVWRVGEPMTRAMVAKSADTRRRNTERRRAKSVPAHLRRYLDMTKEEFMDELPLTMGESIAHTMVMAANVPGLHHLKYVQELLDRAIGRNKATLEIPEPVSLSATRTLGLEQSDEKQIEIMLRKKGFHDLADALATTTAESNQEE